MTSSTGTKICLPGQRGIVLLEILVALVILSVTGSAVLRLASQQITLLSQLKVTLCAVWVADNQLVQLHLNASPHGHEWVQGESLMGGSKWHWRYRYASTDMHGVDQLEIEVSRKGDRSSLVNVSTLVVKP